MVGTVVVRLILPVVMEVVCKVGTLTKTTLVSTPLTVVATVAVAAMLPEVTVVVWRALGVGTVTTIMLVGVPLKMVGTVAIPLTLPDVTVVV